MNIRNMTPDQFAAGEIRAIRSNRMLGSMSTIEELDLQTMNVTDADVQKRAEFNEQLSEGLKRFDDDADADALRELLAELDDDGAWARIYAVKQRAHAVTKRYENVATPAQLRELFVRIGKRNGVDLIAVLAIK